MDSPGIFPSRIAAGADVGLTGIAAADNFSVTNGIASESIGKIEHDETVDGLCFAVDCACTGDWDVHAIKATTTGTNRNREIDADNAGFILGD